jgi:hypothetical protein
VCETRDVIANVIRLAIVAAGAIALAASGARIGGPRQHAVQTSMTVSEPYPETWAALLEVFAEHHWNVKSMHEKSGLLTTDWQDLGDDASRFADCGQAPIGARLQTQVKLEVRTKAGSGGTIVDVAAQFRRLASANAPEVACTSMGALETTIHNEVAVRANKRTKPVTEPMKPAQPAFYCATSPGEPTVSICGRQSIDCEAARDKLANPPGDLGTCTRVDSAWCFQTAEGPRCSETQAACVTLRAGAGATAQGDCAETR